MRRLLAILIFALLVAPPEIGAQLPNFLSAFSFGGTGTTTPKPPSPTPPPNPRTFRIERKNINIDDAAFGNIPGNSQNGQIITAAPPPISLGNFNNIPLSGALQNNYISTSTGNPNPLLSSNPNSNFGSNPGSNFGFGSNSFASSPNVSFFLP